MTSLRHKWMIFNLGALFSLQQVHLNGKLEQKSSTFLLYPLKSNDSISATGLGTSSAQFEGKCNSVPLTNVKRISTHFFFF